LFEFSNSINSRKSLLSSIWIKAIPEFQNNLDALVGRHSQIFASVRFVGFVSIPKYPNDPLHPLNYRRLLLRVKSSALGRNALFPSVRESCYSGEDGLRIEMRFGDDLRFQTAREPLMIPVGRQ
jgi:hypothetical protein